MIGQTISHYRVVEKLGEGGMGVVYKAEDTKLERTVALKFLLPHLVSEDAVRQRFLREAQAAAALSHPNICTVYEIDDLGERTFIAMEFVDGPSVADKIRQRPLPLEEALDIAILTATGLQEAHEKSIVHRDIKSANVLLTSKGQAKITDFGLAHLAERSRLTDSGSTLGTPAYMSPEQARNQPVNHRTDIWSLGVMLYEMLTARLPFEGQHAQAIVYSIINQDPEPVTSLRAGLPLDVDRVIGKCLAKSPDERYQHVDDTLVELRALRFPSAARASVARPETTPGPTESAVPAPKTNRNQRYLLVATCILVAVLAVMWIARLSNSASAPPYTLASAVQFEITPPSGTRLVPVSRGGLVTISPDGSKVAYVARREDGSDVLFVRSLDSAKAQLLDGTEGANSPFWSPDSRQLGFGAEGQLKTIDLERGVVRSLAEAPLFLGGAWLEWHGGTILFSPNVGGELYATPASGGPLTPITRPQSEETSHQWPAAVEGGRFLFESVSKGSARASIFAGDLAARAPVEPKLLLEADSAAEFGKAGRQGYVFFVEGGALVARALETGGMTLRGSAIPIAQQVEFGRARLDRGNFSVSRTGALTYRISPSPFGSAQLTWFDRHGKRLSTVGPPGPYAFVTLAPNGATAAVVLVAGNPPQADVWTADLARSVFTQRTFHPDHLDRAPVWSPDSRQLLISSNKARPGDLVVVDLDSDIEPHPLFPTYPDRSSADFASQWVSAKGPILFYRNSGQGFDIWEYAPGGNPRLLIGGPGNQINGHLSPDGKWLAYASNETGSIEVFVRRYRPLGDRIRVSNAGGNYPLWKGDSRELFYWANDGGLMSVTLPGDAGAAVSAPERLFQTTTPFSPAEFVYQYSVTPDGERFLVVTETETQPATVVLNWRAMAR